MKAKEIRELSEAEIGKQMRDNRKELLQLNLSKNSGKVEQPHMIKQLRRDIARMETILNEMKQAQEIA